jgi:hypothetical protein
MALLKHPFTAIVAGPTKAGKTVWVQKLVQNIENMVSPTPQQVYWCYSEWQPIYSDLEASSPVVHFMQGVPDLQELKNSPEKTKLVILDDFMQEMKGDKRLVQLFTKGSHHWNVSIVHIVQNLFFEGLRTSRVNAQYLILMKNPSDKLQAATLAKQLYPGKTAYFMEAYADACKDSYGYLFVDLCQETPENMRLRSKVFPGELQIAYLPKL